MSCPHTLNGMLVLQASKKVATDWQHYWRGLWASEAVAYLAIAWLNIHAMGCGLSTALGCYRRARESSQQPTKRLVPSNAPDGAARVWQPEPSLGPRSAAATVAPTRPKAQKWVKPPGPYLEPSVWLEGCLLSSEPVVGRGKEMEGKGGTRHSQGWSSALPCHR